MDEMQKYLFDLNGYLVIEDVLKAAELAVLNGIVDGRELPADSLRVSYAGGRHTCPGFLDWGQPFVDLLDHPPVMPVLRFRLGDCFRLDRLYSIITKPGQPMGKLHSDYGASSPIAGSVPGEYYPFPVNEIHSRLRRGLVEPHRLRARQRRFLLPSRQPQEQLQAARDRSPRKESTPPTSSSPRHRPGRSPCSQKPSPTAPRPGAAPTSAAPCCSSTACRRWHGGAAACSPLTTAS